MRDPDVAEHFQEQAGGKFSTLKMIDCDMDTLFWSYQRGAPVH